MIPDLVIASVAVLAALISLADLFADRQGSVWRRLQRALNTLTYALIAWAYYRNLIETVDLVDQWMELVLVAVLFINIAEVVTRWNFANLCKLMEKGRRK